MTVSPAFDATTRAIASYLRDGLNDRARLDAPELGACVVGVRDFYSQLNSQDRLPLVMVYRTNGTGNRHTLRAEYYMPAYTNHEAQSGILNYARYWIIELLGEFNSSGLFDCVRIPFQDFQYLLAFTTLQRAIHPLCRVTFIVEEY